MRRVGADGVTLRPGAFQLPVWKLYPEREGRRFVVTGVMELDTTGLAGVPVRPRHDGGPLALLRLLQFCRARLLASSGGSSLGAA